MLTNSYNPDKYRKFPNFRKSFKKQGQSNSRICLLNNPWMMFITLLQG